MEFMSYEVLFTYNKLNINVHHERIKPGTPQKTVLYKIKFVKNNTKRTIFFIKKNQFYFPYFLFLFSLMKLCPLSQNQY